MNKNQFLIVLIVFFCISNTAFCKKKSNKARESISSDKMKVENNILKQPVQVVIPILENINGPERNWLGNQIQDKLKSNLQDYLGINIVVDSKSEELLKKIQMESESEARDEISTIELGKITTAQFALFSKIRKTNNGYVISADYTNLTTGEQKASVTSKEYIKAEYLYGNTGAVDEITLILADKLGINISELYKNLLTNGTSNFTVEAQLALVEENEANYKKLLKQLDDKIANLNLSTDVNSDNEKRKIEAEKTLLLEKQKTEAKRKSELEESKKKLEFDNKLEVERSIEFITKRDELVKLVEEKASGIRRAEYEKQSVFGQIISLENKKKVLVEIRESVENQCKELYTQYINEKKAEIEKINNKSYSPVELENDKPTKAATKRRENQIIAMQETLYNKFLTDAKAIKDATAVQESELFSEIRIEQKNLSRKRTVDTIGDELQISYGTYSGEKNGWNIFISLYSDGILLYSDNFIINYESITEKKVPNLITELDDSVINEYTNNVEMYNSIFSRGTPLLKFELDYNIVSESDDKPSEYVFNANQIRVINNIDGKIIQTIPLNKKVSRILKPEWDLRPIFGVVEKNEYVRNKEIEVTNRMKSLGIKMIKIPETTILMLETEVTQKLYEMIMGWNPSRFKGSNNPVESVTWFNAIYFCNKLSERIGLEPVYTVYGETNVDKWKWNHSDLIGDIEQNTDANGFRLPTVYEWTEAAKGGDEFKYSGSDNIDEVCWYCKYGETTHPVAQKKANGYGLYDMSGNVSEWLCTSRKNCMRCYKGGAYYNGTSGCEIYASADDFYEYGSGDNLGFRIVRKIEKYE